MVFSKATNSVVVIEGHTTTLGVMVLAQVEHVLMKCHVTIMSAPSVPKTLCEKLIEKEYY